MTVLRPEYNQVSSTNYVAMSYEYEQIQQPWDGQNRPWRCYKPASSTVTVSGCRDGDGANQNTGYLVPAQIAYVSLCFAPELREKGPDGQKV
eukprot:scaffold99914_cov70-Cyclotella_meneghiniana.AAC.1